MDVGQAVMMEMLASGSSSLAHWHRIMNNTQAPVNNLGAVSEADQLQVCFWSCRQRQSFVVVTSLACSCALWCAHSSSLKLAVPPVSSCRIQVWGLCYFMAKKTTMSIWCVFLYSAFLQTYTVWTDASNKLRKSSVLWNSWCVENFVGKWIMNRMGYGI